MKCAKCGIREALPNSLYCDKCEKGYYSTLDPFYHDYYTFKDFYKKIEKLDDFTKFLKIDDVLQIYIFYKITGKFDPLLGPDFEKEHRKADAKLNTLAFEIIRERTKFVNLEQKELRELENSFKELRNLILSERIVSGNLVTHNTILKILRTVGSKESVDAVNMLNQFFEPGSAVYALELLIELATLSNGRQRINKLLSELKRLQKEQKLEQFAYEPILTVEPWEHQKEAFENWSKHGRKGIVSMATATGKTLVGLIAIQKLSCENPNKRIRVLVTAHSKAILNQWRREIVDKFGLPIPHDDYSTPVKFGNTTIEFETIQKLLLSGHEPVELLIVDEVHHLAAPEFRRILERVSWNYFLGLSASPDEGYRLEVFNELGLPIVYEFDLKQAISKGVLPNFEWILHKVPLTAKETEEFIKVSKEIKRRLLNIINSPEFSEFVEKVGGKVKSIVNLWDVLKLVEKARYKGVEIPKELEELVVLVMKRRWIVHRSLPKIEEVTKLAKRYYDKGKKVIIFAMDIESCELVKRKLEDIPEVFVVHSGVKRPFDVITQFRESRRGILIGAKMLDEGIDIPDAEIGINLAASKTRLQLIQRLGRILRRYDNKKPRFHHFVGVPLPEYFIEYEDPFMIFDEVAWVTDIALSMGLEIKIAESYEIYESMERAQEVLKKVPITFNVPSGTVKIDKIAAQFSDCDKLIKSLESINNEIISYNKFVKLVIENVKSATNMKGLWWLYIISNRNPKLIASILRRYALGS